MKKIILSFSFLIIAATLFAQHPIGNDSFALQTQGSSNTLVVSKAGLTQYAGSILTGYADTSAANVGKLKNYPGAQIRIGNAVWMRNNTATAWVEQGGSGADTNFIRNQYAYSETKRAWWDTARVSRIRFGTTNIVLDQTGNAIASIHASGATPSPGAQLSPTGQSNARVDFNAGFQGGSGSGKGISTTWFDSANQASFTINAQYVQNYAGAGISGNDFTPNRFTHAAMNYTDGIIHNSAGTNVFDIQTPGTTTLSDSSLRLPNIKNYLSGGNTGVVWNNTTKRLELGSSGGGGGSQSWAQTLAVSPDLTADILSNPNGHHFEIFKDVNIPYSNVTYDFTLDSQYINYGVTGHTNAGNLFGNIFTGNQFGTKMFYYHYPETDGVQQPTNVANYINADSAGIYLSVLEEDGITGGKQFWLGTNRKIYAEIEDSLHSPAQFVIDDNDTLKYATPQGVAQTIQPYIISPNWQQTLDNGSDLDKDNIVNANHHTFGINEGDQIFLQARKSDFSFATVQVINTDFPLRKAELISSDGLGEHTTQFDVYDDSIKIESFELGNHYLPLSVNGNYADAAGNITVSAGIGTVTNVSGTTNQIDVATGTTTPVISLHSGGTLPGAWALGTPASVNLTNGTSLPESGVTNLVSDLAAKQATLVSGTNIKTVNSSSLLGSGNVAVGDALVANPLSQFAATTSAQLASVLTNETGAGVAVFGTSPDFTTGITIGGVTVPTISSTNTLTNKTIAAGSNTITGLINSNLSGSAGITNANLANSAITINGTSTSLGGSIDVRPVSASVSGSDATTTSATAGDVTGLSIAVGANKKYKLTATLWIGCNNTGGVRFAINGPSGSAVLSGIYAGSNTSAATVQNVRSSAIGTLTGSGNAFNKANSSTGMVTLVAFITTSSTAGNITIQFASANAGETSTVFIGSTFDIVEEQ